MTREELIAHLEHLAEYVKYSEDAPALREVIEMLKCSENPNSSEERTETHACDLIERETARRIIGSPRSKEQMLRMLEATPPAQPDHSADVSKMVNGDAVSRQEAIDYCYQLINVEHQQGSDEMNYGQERVSQTETILHHLEFMPSAQKKGYTKADYIMALHKEYGCSLTRAEEAHNKALEYLRDNAMMKG